MLPYCWNEQRKLRKVDFNGLANLTADSENVFQSALLEALKPDNVFPIEELSETFDLAIAQPTLPRDLSHKKNENTTALIAIPDQAMVIRCYRFRVKAVVDPLPKNFKLSST